ncbi:MAG: hypothetical protein IPI82_05315 [Candidatus Microthrix sp.]|nr:hypothetical protein [Candidatus Microthrix sp.]MBK7321869.1 hypothetical protein [Candidatus Microthrix sp.]
MQRSLETVLPLHGEVQANPTLTTDAPLGLVGRRPGSAGSATVGTNGRGGGTGRAVVPAAAAAATTPGAAHVLSGATATTTTPGGSAAAATTTATTILVPRLSDPAGSAVPAGLVRTVTAVGTAVCAVPSSVGTALAALALIADTGRQEHHLCPRSRRCRRRDRCWLHLHRLRRHPQQRS